MKSFFVNMNFVRAVMVLCLLAAAALGYMGYEAKDQVEVLRTQVKKTAPFLGREIQELAIELNELKKIESGSEFQSVEDPIQYVRQMAGHESVSVGLMAVKKKADKSWVPGTVDKSYAIEPDDRKRPYPRAKIANYMYIMEVESPFIVVTKAEMKQLDKVKPEEFASDRWTFKIEVTTRTPKED